MTIEVDVDAAFLMNRSSACASARDTHQQSRRAARTSQAERSQLANRDRALARMEELLRDALEERAYAETTRVSRAQKRRRVEEKKRRGKRSG